MCVCVSPIKSETLSICDFFFVNYISVELGGRSYLKTEYAKKKKSPNLINSNFLNGCVTTDNISKYKK